MQAIDMSVSYNAAAPSQSTVCTTTASAPAGQSMGSSPRADWSFQVPSPVVLTSPAPPRSTGAGQTTVVDASNANGNVNNNTSVFGSVGSASGVTLGRADGTILRSSNFAGAVLPVVPDTRDEGTRGETTAGAGSSSTGSSSIRSTSSSISGSDTPGNTSSYSGTSTGFGSASTSMSNGSSGGPVMHPIARAARPVNAGGSSSASSSQTPAGTWLAPLRKRIDSEEISESTPRGGSTPGAAKRRRRDGSDVLGYKPCVFQLTPDENIGFMDRIRELFDSKKMCDVTLRVEGHEFRAHKVVLACSKSFLGALVSTGMREAEQDVIELKDISPNEFKTLLDYMYNKPISVNSHHMVDLLGLANRYQVEGLKTQICQALLVNLDHDNACAVFAAADHYLCHSLKEQAFSKIVQHFALAARSDGWSALSKSQLSELLCSDQVLDCDESVVFDAAVRWLRESPPRRKLASEVMSMVRFPLMDAGLLSDVIKKHEITQTPECQALIAEAWEHHALKAVGREGLTGTPRTKQRRRSCSFKKHTLLTEHSDAVSALAVINGKLISGSWDTNIKVWDPQSWTTERTLSDHTGPVRCFAQVADRLLSGSDDGSVKVWNTETWSLVRSLDDHTDAVNAVIDCAGRLASGSDDGTIKLWNTANWQCEVTIHQADHMCGVLALATCGDYLVSGSDGGIKIWNTTNWTCHKEVLGHGDEVWALAVVGDRLISGSIDSTIRVWDTETWGCEKLLEDHHGPVYALTVLEGKLVSASSDHTIRVWGADWECCRTLECSGVWSLSVFNDRLVSGSKDNAVKVWGA